MSFVPKPNGKVRSVVDLVQLNKHVDRQTHPFPTSKDIVSKIPTGSRVFAVFDCTHGYWQIPLSEESWPYTCFITEWGQYQYKRAPMGLISERRQWGRLQSGANGGDCRVAPMGRLASGAQ